MDTICINSKNSKIFYPHRLLLNLSDKTNLKRNDKYAALYQIFKIILSMLLKNILAKSD